MLRALALVLLADVELAMGMAGCGMHAISLTCWNCNGEGHLLRDCPHPHVEPPPFMPPAIRDRQAARASRMAKTRLQKGKAAQAQK